jgi:hypothetical protein
MNIMTSTPSTSASGATRAILVGLLALVAASALSLAGAHPASAATSRRWTGAGADANWTNPANWMGGAPVAGDSLIFGDTGARRTNVNNFPVDTSFDSIVFEGTGYNLTGNRVTLTDGLFTYHDTPAALTDTVTLAIKVPELLYFNASAADHNVTYKGGFVLNAGATFQGPGTQTVTGPVTGAGAINATGYLLNLAGTSTSTGPTKITGGAVVVVTGSYPGRPVSVSGSGGLAGSGTTGPVSASSSNVVTETLFPQAPGVLKVTGDLTMSSASTYGVLVKSSAAGQYGQAVVSGTVKLAGVSLLMGGDGATPIAVGQVLTIVKNNGPAAISGTFVNTPEGSKVLGNHNTYRISYKGGPSGRDVTLTVLTAG